MLDPGLAEDLRTIAEVSVTMAGFVAIAGVLRLRGLAAAPDLRTRGWLVSILATGVQAAFLALVPLVLAHIPALEENFWRWCHLIAFLVNLTSWLFWAQVSFRGESKDAIIGAVGWLDWTLVLIGLLVFALVAAVVFGWLTPYAPQIYLLLLMQLLLVSSIMFVRQFAETRGLMNRAEPDE